MNKEYFGDDLHSNLDPVLICLYALCQIGDSTVRLMILQLSLISILYTSLTLLAKTYSYLGGGLNSRVLSSFSVFDLMQ